MFRDRPDGLHEIVHVPNTPKPTIDLPAIAQLLAPN